MKKQYICPVCGYGRLTEPPENHAICPSCGTHFAYHDMGSSHAFLHQEWVSAGCPWFSQTTVEPDGWAAYRESLVAPRVYCDGVLVDPLTPAPRPTPEEP